jgi:hypothetical protein
MKVSDTTIDNRTATGTTPDATARDRETAMNEWRRKVRFITPDGCILTDGSVDWLARRIVEALAAARLAGAAEATERAAKLVNVADQCLSVLDRLNTAQMVYRKNYELKGDDAIETGRAWDELRKAGNAAQMLIEAHKTARAQSEPRQGGTGGDDE